MQLDDPAPMVRQSMAEALADSEDAPPAVILALASDQPEIAACVLSRSPVLLDTDLVDFVGSGAPGTAGGDRVPSLAAVLRCCRHRGSWLSRILSDPDREPGRYDPKFLAQAHRRATWPPGCHARCAVCL
jgi:hypothetical protein